MRMNCSEAQAELPLFVGGDLESSCHERVAVHLATCEPCRSALAGANDAREVLRVGLNKTADLHGAFVASSSEPSVWSGLRSQLHAEGLINVGSAQQPATVSEKPGTASHAGPVAPGDEAAPAGKLLFWFSRSAAAAGLLLLGGLAGQWWTGNSTSTNSPGPGLIPTVRSSPLVQNQLVGLGANSGLVAEVQTPNTSALIPVVDSGHSNLKQVLRPQDSFLYNDANARYLYSQPRPVLNNFPPRSGNSMVSGTSGALPPATARTDGVR
jgi:hypothetical protein